MIYKLFGNIMFVYVFICVYICMLLILFYIYVIVNFCCFYGGLNWFNRNIVILYMVYLNNKVKFLKLRLRFS